MSEGRNSDGNYFSWVHRRSIFLDISDKAILEDALRDDEGDRPSKGLCEDGDGQANGKLGRWKGILDGDNGLTARQLLLESKPSEREQLNGTYCLSTTTSTKSSDELIHYPLCD